MRKALHLLTRAIEIFCVMSMLTIIVAVLAQVVNRYIFNKSFSWAEELSILLMIWVAFLGSTLAIGRDSHSRIDFFLNKLPQKARKVVDITNHLICAVFVACLAYFSIDIVKAKMTIMSAGFTVSTAFWPLAITVGGSLMFVYLIIMALDRAFEWNLSKGDK